MSGRDSMAPHVSQGPAGYRETAGPGTFRQAEGPRAARRGPRQRDSRFIAVLLGIAAAVALPAPTPARASVVPAPTLDGPTCPTRRASNGLPNPNQLAPAGTAGPTPSTLITPSGYELSGGNVLILGGNRDLLHGGEDADEGDTTPPEPSAAPSPEPSPTKLANPGPQVPALDCAHPDPTPGGGVAAGKPLPRIPADPGQPVVAETLSTVTGSMVTMIGLRVQGIVDLPTAGGTVRALKFSMDRAITDDFLLRAPGPAGRTMRLATDRLTLSGGVAVYATRFVGRLPGVTITLTPDLPFPDEIATTSPITITFSDPAFDLAFMSSHSLTARPALKLTLD